MGPVITLVATYIPRWFVFTSFSHKVHGYLTGPGFALMLLDATGGSKSGLKKNANDPLNMAESMVFFSMRPGLPQMNRPRVLERTGAR